METLSILITRFIEGDAIHSVGTVLAIVIAAIIMSIVRWPTKYRIIFGVVLALVLVIIVHRQIDYLQVVYVTPLAEPMHIIIRP